MRMVIRCDSSTLIGTGHVMRCLTLADELKQRGVEVSFISRENPGNLCEFIRDRGYVVYSLPQLATETDFVKMDADETKEILLSKYLNNVEWLIVDNYSIGVNWELAVRPYVKKIMVIDDLANRLHDCDILLDQNLFRNMNFRYDGLTPLKCVNLFGPQYALLRNEFRDAQRNRTYRSWGIKRILIFFGGSDFTNETAKVLKAINELSLPEISVDVVVGSANPYRDEIKELCMVMPNVSYYCQINNMATLMLTADLSIGGGGSTAWERCCVGLPSIVVPIADNQVEPMRQLAEVGAIELYTGDKTFEGYFSILQKFIIYKQSLEVMVQKGLQLYDGKGAERVAGKLLAGDN